MLKCLKCRGRMFIDRLYTSLDHIETFCIVCGSRKFYHPPRDSKEGQWILQLEISRANSTIMSL